MHSWGQEHCTATTSLCKWGTTALLLQPPHSQSLSSSHHFPMHPEELERLYRGFHCLLDRTKQVIPSPPIWDHQGTPLEAQARRSLKTTTFCLAVPCAGGSPEHVKTSSFKPVSLLGVLSYCPGIALKQIDTIICLHHFFCFSRQWEKKRRAYREADISAVKLLQADVE